jgi:hypothetical protein
MNTARTIAETIFNPDDEGSVYTAPDGRTLAEVCESFGGELIVRDRHGIGHTDGRDIPRGGWREFWFSDNSRIVDQYGEWDYAL